MLGLPQVRCVKAIEVPHFPTSQQAIIWRNWGLVPTERIAKVLKTSEDAILDLAEEIGLRSQPHVDKYWLERGYITIIRANWHLLTYNQILTLLGWTDEQMKYALKEDDFLYIKLGSFKPQVEEVTYRPLSHRERERTAEMREVLGKHFSETDDQWDAFGFLRDLAQAPQMGYSYSRPAEDDEIVIDSSWKVLYPRDNTWNLQAFVDRFIAEMEKRWGVKLETCLGDQAISSNKIVLAIESDLTLPCESHRIEVSEDGVYISAVDERGLLRGLQWLQRQMDERGGPYLGCLSLERKTRFDLRLIYSYFALYGDPFSDPANDPYPHGLLSRLSGLGVNGIWLQGVLYSLVPWDKAPELSKGWEKRIEGLRNLVKRAGEYGIGVYLYLNEPRAMPEEFFEGRSQWKGAAHRGLVSLCTSHGDIQDYLRNGVARLFTEVPELAGVFTITMSENHTNCYSHIFSGEKSHCPRCSKRSQAEVIAEVNNLIAQGAHGVNPDARVIGWTWGWHPKWSDQAIHLLDDKVSVMCTCEEGIPTNIGGIKGEVVDYSISIPGPGNRAIGNWERASKKGHRTVAKVQLNNTWECSAVPYLPVLELLLQRLEGLVDSGVDGLMLSWTLGGYPSLNLELASETYWEESGRDSSILDLRGFARHKFGEEATSDILKAWEIFSNAFKEFPFHISVLYTAPQNYGPMNLLHEEPTGYKATMLGFPYDDLNTWRGIYPVETFEEAFGKMSTIWKDGLNFIDRARGKVPEDKSNYIEELQNVSRGTYCHFRSTYLQIKFIRLRDALLTAEGDTNHLIEGIIEVLNEEIEVAKTLYHIIMKDSRIGYEASNHYFYTPRVLQEKVINCEYLKAKYSLMATK